MKIFFGIIGQPRCIDLVIKNLKDIFIEHELSLNLCITSNYKNYETEYINNINIFEIINMYDINNILLTFDNDDSKFRNSINYSKKISKIIKIIDINDYDLYIIIRSDFIFEDCKFLNKIIKNDILYSCNVVNDNININNSINDNIIITKTYKCLYKLINIYEYIKENPDYMNIKLYNYIIDNNIHYEKIDINYKLILSKCNIIAICGDSGSGKTTLSKYIEKLFEKQNFVTLETDRYHKWERGNDNYIKYTHLHPYANHLEKMNNDIFKLKIGHEIFTVDYDHNIGKFTQPEKIKSNENIIICGLHTLYNKQTNDVIDIKIFMDTDRELIKKWKIKRDSEERGHSITKIIEQINKREKDYEEYIKNQKNNADIIINFFEETNILICKFILKTKKYINKIMLNFNYSNKYIVENEYIYLLIHDNYYNQIINILTNII